MSQRGSGYERIDGDLYETPEWVTRALLPHLPDERALWEPAAGGGKMSRALAAAGHLVIATDIATGQDFLDFKEPETRTIVTNPPYSIAQKFIEHALHLSKPGGLVAMLLRTDYDHAKSRRHLFADCPAFAKKLVLTRRIVWFERKGAAPSFNHAWYIWDHSHNGPPTLAYGP